jgi:hypothetical protein
MNSGAGESGKTTIIKQMKILHVEGFTTIERQEKALEIRRNLLEAIKARTLGFKENSFSYQKKIDLKTGVDRKYVIFEASDNT